MSSFIAPWHLQRANLLSYCHDGVESWNLVLHVSERGAFAGSAEGARK